MNNDIVAEDLSATFEMEKKETKKGR